MWSMRALIDLVTGVSWADSRAAIWLRREGGKGGDASSSPLPSVVTLGSLDGRGGEEEEGEGGAVLLGLWIESFTVGMSVSTAIMASSNELDSGPTEMS
jgi:hypothetical protein